MAKIKCKLIVYSNSVFLQQIYTGFFILFKNGLIDIYQEIQDDKELKGKNYQNIHAHLRIILNDSINLHYDTHDDWGVEKEFLKDADYYFKRSYSQNHLESLGSQQKKIFPLGLNYCVYPNSFDKFLLQRNVILSDGVKKLSGIVRPLNILDRFLFMPRLHIMQSLPDYKANPKIIFMVKPFDPHSKPDRPREKIEERIQINTVRASCIKLLRKEFGNNFYGGFYHTDYSKNNYKEYLMPDSKSSLKKNYIKLLKSFNICVANTGLHGSIGWKFAEYVAFSKAIITEKLNYEIPGDLENGKNYLEFTSPEDCVNKASQLFSDKELRSYIMTNNAKYYQSYLRPDSLVLNTILTALLEYHNRA